MLAGLCVAAAAIAAVSSSASPRAQSPLQSEILTLAAQMEQNHPDLYHTVSRARFRRAAATLARRAPGLSRPQLVVGLMRLTALPGERDGHNGIYPADPAHERPLHLFPLRLYDFADGLHVVDTIDRPDLVGRRLVAIDGVPVARVVRLVRPLIPRDNEWSLRNLLPEYVVTDEVLRGLGITETAAATFSFAGGLRVALRPVESAAYVSALGYVFDPPVPAAAPPPLWLQRLDQTQWLTTLEGGRVVYLGYRLTTDSTDALARRLLRLARRPAVRRVIVDVRLNHGGNNRTYGPLLEALAQPAVNRAERLTLLVGRGTFSAAGNFATDVDRFTNATLVGEPSGGAPNQWGDPLPLRLTRAGLTAYVATSYQRYGAQGDTRLAVEPDVRVELRAADFFAGRDPVLSAALRPR